MINPQPMRDAVRDLDPAIIETSGMYNNVAFPWRFWQSFRLPGRDCSVDISVDCMGLPDGVELSADICISEGSILAEFETVRIAQKLSAIDKKRATHAWFCALEDFLRTNASLLVSKVRELGG